MHLSTNNILPPHWNIIGTSYYIILCRLYKCRKYYILLSCGPGSANNNSIALPVWKSSSADETKIANVVKKKKWCRRAPSCRSTGPQPLAVFEINNRRDRVFHGQPHSITLYTSETFYFSTLFLLGFVFFTLIINVRYI